MSMIPRPTNIVLASTSAVSNALYRPSDCDIPDRGVAEHVALQGTHANQNQQNYNENNTVQVALPTSAIFLTSCHGDSTARYNLLRFPKLQAERRTDGVFGQH